MVVSVMKLVFGKALLMALKHILKSKTLKNITTMSSFVLLFGFEKQIVKLPSQASNHQTKLILTKFDIVFIF